MNNQITYKVISDHEHGQFIAEGKKLEHKYIEADWRGDWFAKHFYICAFDRDKIVGSIKFKVGGNESIRHPGYRNWIGYISVADQYKKQGIGSRLVRELFQFATKENFDHIIQSCYSDEGEQYIKKVFDSIATKYPQIIFLQPIE